jgi:hypothetical protein
MTENDDQLLVDEIARMGTSALARSLIRFVAKCLPNDTYEVSLKTAAPPRSVVSVATHLLSTEGKYLRTEEQADVFSVKGFIGAGALGMNPTLVNIVITSLPHTPTHILIQGKAKEGLIRQHAGQKAAQRLADLLLNLVREMS